MVCKLDYRNIQTLIYLYDKYHLFQQFHFQKKTPFQKLVVNNRSSLEGRIIGTFYFLGYFLFGVLFFKVYYFVARNKFKLVLEIDFKNNCTWQRFAEVPVYVYTGRA